MTQMTSDLYKAILSMDSYNRGYGASLKFGTLPDNSDSEANIITIGKAQIFRLLLNLWQNQLVSKALPTN